MRVLRLVTAILVFIALVAFMFRSLIPEAPGPLHFLGPDDMPYPRPEFSCAALSTDGRWLLVGFEKHELGTMGLPFPPPKRDFKYLSLWDVKTGIEVKTLDGHDQDVTFVAFLPGEKQAISASKEGVFKIWDLNAGKEIRSMKFYQENLDFAAVSADGASVYAIGRDRSGAHANKFEQWNINTGNLLRTFSIRAQNPEMDPHGFKLSPDEKFAFIRFHPGARDYADNQLWDLVHDRSLFIWEASKGWGQKGAFSPDGKYLVISRWDKKGRKGNLVLIEIETLKVALTFEEKPMGKDFLSIHFSPEGEKLDSYDRDGMLRSWEGSTGKEYRSRQCEPIPWEGAAVFSKHGKVLFTGSQWTSSSETLMKLWDIESGKLLRTLPMLRLPS